MDTCVICLEDFRADRQPIYCEYCKRPLGHAKCIAGLLSVREKKCPRCNKGVLKKPQTRLQKRDKQLFFSTRSLNFSGDKYVPWACDLIKTFLKEPNVHHLETPYLLYMALDAHLGDLLSMCKDLDEKVLVVTLLDQLKDRLIVAFD